MKRILWSFCILLCFTAARADEDCLLSWEEAMREYNKGNYSLAKELFDYVSTQCPTYVEVAAAMSGKCQTAMTPTLNVNKTSISAGGDGKTEHITVSSNRDWEVQRSNGVMYSVTRNENTLTVKILANNSYSSRSDYFIIKTVGGEKSVQISLSQSAKPQPPSDSSSSSSGSSSSGSSSAGTSSGTSSTSSSSSSSAYLTLSKSSIHAGASGITEYISVSSNRSWEVQYPSATMYSVSRSGNTLTVRINANTTYSSRSDFFYVKTTDGSKVMKVSLSQSANNQTNLTPRSSYLNDEIHTGSHNTYSRSSLTKYQQYICNLGNFEITWFGLQAGVGTGVSYGYRFFRLRWGPVQLSPADIDVDYSFLSGSLYGIYRPTLDFFIPFQEDAAVYFGGGPTICIGEVYNELFYSINAGIHWHWGWGASSSDFFLRYDGAFMVGVSIQWSTGF